MGLVKKDYEEFNFGYLNICDFGMSGLVIEGFAKYPFEPLGGFDGHIWDDYWKGQVKTTNLEFISEPWKIGFNRWFWWEAPFLNPDKEIISLAKDGMKFLLSSYNKKSVQYNEIHSDAERYSKFRDHLKKILKN